MFEPKGFGARIFSERYAKDHSETWSEACERLAYTVASGETNGNVKIWRDVFYDDLVENRFMPGGRIWYGAGRPKGQLLNCFVVPTEDSREGWGKTVSDAIVISGTGGGIGLNMSPIRPRGSVIHGHSSPATGAVSLMEIINAAGEVIRAGGGRRVALMLCLGLDHPDTLEFMDKKLDLKQLNNANVSNVFMNESPDEFLRKVERDELHEFVWQEKVVASIPARELWAKILDNSVRCGEPGILNGHLANEQNNIAYYQPLISTNPCGEIWLERYGCCDLGALVLPRFVVNGQLDKKLLGRTIRNSVRFLDNVLDVNTYPLREIEENCKTVRRIGMGVMGLHDVLIRLGMRYTSDEAFEFVGDLFSFIKKKAYEVSIDLAIEKGSFPALNRGKFVESGFCKRSLSDGIKERILANGIRNCALITIAPTGTTALPCDVNSSLEPFPALGWKRNFRSGEDLDSEIIEQPLFAELKGDPEKVKLFETALEIPVEKHLQMQATCQRHVDNAISKTINLPKHYTGADLDRTLRKYVGQLKGCTLYRQGSRGDEPIEAMTLDEMLRIDCPRGSCSL